MQDTVQKPKNEPQGQVRFFTWEYEVPKELKTPEVLNSEETTELPQEQADGIVEQLEVPVEDAALHTSTDKNNMPVVVESAENPAAENTDSPQSEQIEFSTAELNIPPEWQFQANVNKRYSSGSYGRLAVVFNDRKLMYYLFSALFLVSSTVIATLIFKLAEVGNENPFNFITKYDSYSRVLPRNFYGALLFSAPILISSLLVFFGGFTIFSKFLSSLWIITVGASWSVFSVHIFNSLGVFEKIAFTVLSALLALNCIVFSAEAGKYSHLNYYGRNELLKFSNVKNFSVIYMFFCFITCFILYLYLNILK